MINDNVADIASKIGVFYLQKNNGDFKAAELELLELRITEIMCCNDYTIVIKLCRPGLLIGRRGSNIDMLETFLGIKILVVEDVSILDYLIPFNPEKLFEA